MKTTALVAHGNSGGALFNNDGELVGVASSIELEGVSNIALGIPAWSNFIMPWHKYSDPPERVWKAFQSVTMP